MTERHNMRRPAGGASRAGYYSQGLNRNQTKRDDREWTGRTNRHGSVRESSQSGRPSRNAARYGDSGSETRTRVHASRQSRAEYVYEPQFTAGPYGLSQPSRQFFGLPLIAVAVVAVVLVAFLVVNATGMCSSTAQLEPTHPAVFSATKEQPISYTLNPDDLLSVADSDKVESVNLEATAPAFSVGSALLGSINADIAAIEKKAPCGFVFMDVSTGRLLAYHAGKTMYVASASKAPLVYYAVTHPEDEAGLSDEDRERAEAAIVESDNDSFFELCNTYFNEGYLKWLLTFDIEDPEGKDDYFPTMSPRALGSVWADILQYLQKGSEDARWLESPFSTTEESYIRSGLKGTGATVFDKAGWMYDAEVSSVSDAGIVRADGRMYLMVIVTEQSEMDSSSRDNVARLARDLFNARGMLASHITVEV